MDNLILAKTHVDEALRYRALNNRPPSPQRLEQIKEYAFYQQDYESMLYLYENHLEGNEIQLQLALEKYLKGLSPLSSYKKEIEAMLENILK